MRRDPTLISVLRPTVGSTGRLVTRSSVIPGRDAGVMRAACAAERIVTAANVVSQIVQAQPGSRAEQRVHQVVLVRCVRPAPD